MQFSLAFFEIHLCTVLLKKCGFSMVCNAGSNDYFMNKNDFLFPTVFIYNFMGLGAV